MTKFLQKARERMEKKGTVGSLRAIAQRRGLLSGKDDTLTEDDLNALAAAAKRENNTALMRKVNFARNAMKANK